MNNSVKTSNGLIFTNCFSYSECLLLVKVLQNNFGLKATIKSTGVPSQYKVFILKEFIVYLKNIVGPFVIPEMKYKLLP